MLASPRHSHYAFVAKWRSGCRSNTYLHCVVKRLPWQHSVYYQTTSVWAHREGRRVVGVDTVWIIFFLILSPVLLHSSVNSRSGAHQHIRLLHSEVSTPRTSGSNVKEFPSILYTATAKESNRWGKEIWHIYEMQRTWMDNCHLLYQSFLHFNLLQSVL